MLNPAQRNDLLAELISMCDPEQDALATWAPRRGQCIEVVSGKLRVRLAAQGHSTMKGNFSANQILAGAGNYLLCYDIRDEDRLRAVAASIHPMGAAIQRSVYWLRQSLSDMNHLLNQLCRLTAEDDVTWVYPLAHAQDLWRVQTQPSSLLPVNHRIRQRNQL